MLCSQWPKQWSHYLPWAKLWYNTTYHASTKMSPFQALYGRLPSLIPAYSFDSTSIHEVDITLRTRDELLQQLKQNL